MKAKPIKIEALTSADFEVKPRSVKTLCLDLETAPLIGYSWQKWQTNIIEFIHESYMLTWSAKWLDGKQITKSLPDYHGYLDDPRDDKALMRDLYDLVEEADIIVAHNGNSFDFRRMCARFLIHGFAPTHKYQTRDTLKMVKAKFGFVTNSLNDLGERLGYGKKIKTDFELWKDCLAGDMQAWRKMAKYCRQDVLLLESIYLRLRPWDGSHPNFNVIMDRPTGCTRCSGVRMVKTGFNYTRTGRRQEYKCQECGARSSGAHQKIALIQ